MTDKEKIRAEVERLYKAWRWYSSIGGKYGCDRCEAYKELLKLIDSLLEEPVSKDLEKAAKEYRLSASLDKERYLTFRSSVMNAFVAGANWQKEQMMKELAKMPWDKALKYIVKEAEK